MSNTGIVTSEYTQVLYNSVSLKQPAALTTTEYLQVLYTDHTTLQISYTIPVETLLEESETATSTGYVSTFNQSVLYTESLPYSTGYLSTFNQSILYQESWPYSTGLISTYNISVLYKDYYDVEAIYSIPVENQAITADISITGIFLLPVENVGSIEDINKIPIENIGSELTNVTNIVPVETKSTIETINTVLVDNNSTIISTNKILIERNTGVLDFHTIPIENIGTLEDVDKIPVENIGFTLINITGILPVENITTLSDTGTSPVEEGLKVDSIYQTSVEIQSGNLITFETPIETLASLSTTSNIPIEASGFTTFSFNMPVDTYTKIDTTAHIPVEQFSGIPTITFTVPTEFLQAVETHTIIPMSPSGTGPSGVTGIFASPVEYLQGFSTCEIGYGGGSSESGFLIVDKLVKLYDIDEDKPHHVFLSVESVDSVAFGDNLCLLSDTTAKWNYAVDDAILSGGTINFYSGTRPYLTRTAGDWTTDGFATDQLLTVRNALNSVNDGNYRVYSVASTGMYLYNKSDLEGWDIDSSINWGNFHTSVITSANDTSVLISGGNYHAYGTYDGCGAIHVWEYFNNTWSYLQVLQPTGTNALYYYGFFGGSCGVKGNEIFGTSPSKYDEYGNLLSEDVGNLFVFQRSGSGEKFAQTQRLCPSLGGARLTGDKHFGQYGTDHLSVHGNVVAVGARYDRYDQDGNDHFPTTTGPGAVYIWTSGEEGTWTEFQKISPTGTGVLVQTSSSEFGWAVDVYDNTIAIGARYHRYDFEGNNNLSAAGAVWIYKRSIPTGYFEFSQFIIPTGVGQRASNFQFGRTLALYDNDLVIGSADNVDETGGSHTPAGAATVYRRTDESSNFVKTQKIMCTGLSSTNGFGTLVDLKNNWLAVSARSDQYDSNEENYLVNAGAIYLYAKSGSDYIFDRKVVATGYLQRQASDSFGRGMGIDLQNDQLTLMATSWSDSPFNPSSGFNEYDVQSSAYIFNTLEQQQEEEQTICANPIPVAFDYAANYYPKIPIGHRGVLTIDDPIIIFTSASIEDINNLPIEPLSGINTYNKIPVDKYLYDITYVQSIPVETYLKDITSYKKINIDIQADFSVSYHKMPVSHLSGTFIYPNIPIETYLYSITSFDVLPVETSLSLELENNVVPVDYLIENIYTISGFPAEIQRTIWSKQDIPIDKRFDGITLNTRYIIPVDTLKRVDSLNHNVSLIGAFLWDNDYGYYNYTNAASNAQNNGVTVVLPALPDVGDGFFFGGADPFDTLIFNITKQGIWEGEISWLYWNGSDWVEVENLNDDTDGFRNAWVNQVNFDVPSDWQPTVVNGVFGYFVKAEISSFTSMDSQAYSTGVILRNSLVSQGASAIIQIQNAGEYNPFAKLVIQIPEDCCPKWYVYITKEDLEEDEMTTEYTTKNCKDFCNTSCCCSGTECLIFSDDFSYWNYSATRPQWQKLFEERWEEINGTWTRLDVWTDPIVLDPPLTTCWEEDQNVVVTEDTNAYLQCKYPNAASVAEHAVDIAIPFYKGSNYNEVGSKIRISLCNNQLWAELEILAHTQSSPVDWLPVLGCNGEICARITLSSGPSETFILPYNYPYHDIRFRVGYSNTTTVLWASAGHFSPLVYDTEGYVCVIDQVGSKEGNYVGIGTGDSTGGGKVAIRDFYFSIHTHPGYICTNPCALELPALSCAWRKMGPVMVSEPQDQPVTDLGCYWQIHNGTWIYTDNGPYWQLGLYATTPGATVSSITKQSDNNNCFECTEPETYGYTQFRATFVLFAEGDTARVYVDWEAGNGHCLEVTCGDENGNGTVVKLLNGGAVLERIDTNPSNPATADSKIGIVPGEWFSLILCTSEDYSDYSPQSEGDTITYDKVIGKVRQYYSNNVKTELTLVAATTVNGNGRVAVGAGGTLTQPLWVGHISHYLSYNPESNALGVNSDRTCRSCNNFKCIACPGDDGIFGLVISVNGLRSTYYDYCNCEPLNGTYVVPANITHEAGVNPFLTFTSKEDPGCIGTVYDGFDDCQKYPNPFDPGGPPENYWEGGGGWRISWRIINYNILDVGIELPDGQYCLVVTIRAEQAIETFIGYHAVNAVYVKYFNQNQLCDEITGTLEFVGIYDPTSLLPATDYPCAGWEDVIVSVETLTDWY